MNTAATLQDILRFTDHYQELLAGFTEEEFQRTPAEGVWSYAELYSHIFQANLGSLVAMERCIHGTQKSSESLSLLARLVFLFGRFPPGRFKAPRQIAALTRKISIEEAANLIVRFKEKVSGLAPQVKKASAHVKYAHPRLGMLNAAQWLQFIRIHTRHHFKQAARIRKMLTNASC